MAQLVVGVDIDSNAIKHASNTYIRRNLQYKVGSITDISIEGNKIFEVIVCFDAIEHIEDQNKFLEEVKRLLAPEGLFIVSTPNRWAYSNAPRYENPVHVHGLYFDEFKALLEKYFGQVKFLGHNVYCNSNIWPLLSEAKTSVVEYVVESNAREFVFVEREKKTPLSVIAIASDRQEKIDEKASVSEISQMNCLNSTARSEHALRLSYRVDRRRRSLMTRSMSSNIGWKISQMSNLTKTVRNEHDLRLSYTSYRKDGAG